MEKRNVIGITMGDPGSIGPEITVKALGNPSIYEKIRPLVIGDAWVMAEALKITGGGKILRFILCIQWKNAGLNRG